ncbi:HAD hydrolase-like protein [Candidatus Woesearchaeota archaeon]|nr:HAD hydrolase-like protein [Candidatus Woesearchaeota archaeon]
MVFTNKFEVIRTLMFLIKNLKYFKFKFLIPSEYLDNINKLEPELLRKKGIDTIIWDVEGTITEYRGKISDKENKFLTKFKGFNNYILTNAPEEMCNELSNALPEIPIITGYYHILKKKVIIRKIINHKKIYVLVENNKQIAIKKPINKLNIQRIRKPSVLLLKKVLFIENITPKNSVMIGDNTITDIFPANYLGMFTIQIKPPTNATSFPLTLRMLRHCEYILVWIFKLIKK